VTALVIEELTISPIADVRTWPLALLPCCAWPVSAASMATVELTRALRRRQSVIVCSLADMAILLSGAHSFRASSVTHTAFHLGQEILSVAVEVPDHAVLDAILTGARLAD
jgi:hypothetical protein